MSLKLYYDLMSQPSRALYILLKYSNCKFELKPVDLRKGQHFSDEYTSVNRLQKVPVIDHNGFVLTESVAIMKYLARENLIPENLYPRDSKRQARVDEFLAWQHVGIRLYCAVYFRIKFLNAMITGKPSDEQIIKKYENQMVQALDTFSKHFLSNGTEFVCGDHITVADLLAACELEQPRMAGFDPAEKYEAINVWLKKVREHFNPYYDEGHVIVNKIIRKRASPLASAKL